MQSEASSVTAVPPSPPPLAVPHTASRAQHDALTDFFGGRGQRLRAERHHTRGDARRESRVPPPYSPDWDGEKLPGYSQAVSSPEPDTVAKQLFKYGFLFPVFWAIGTYLLFVPLQVSPDWEEGRSPEEKEKMLADMRQTETKWAKRCFWALRIFIACLVTVIVLVVVLTRH